LRRFSCPRRLPKRRSNKRLLLPKRFFKHCDTAFVPAFVSDVLEKLKIDQRKTEPTCKEATVLDIQRMKKVWGVIGRRAVVFCVGSGVLENLFLFARI
jgi:hypothetical protein